MTESPEVAPKANGLQTVLNVIAAPQEAFASLREAPTWGWALIITMILLAITIALSTPASQHATLGFTQHFLNESSFAAKMSDAQKQKMLSDAQNPQMAKVLFGAAVQVLIIPFLAVVFNTLLMLLANVIGKGTGSFKQYWSGSFNILVPSFGLAQLVSGLVLALRGPDSFNSILDIVRAVPSLLWLAPGIQHGYLVGALGTVGVFLIWGAYLNATMLKVIGNVSGGVAWTFSILVLVLTTILPGLFSIFS